MTKTTPSRKPARTYVKRYVEVFGWRGYLVTIVASAGKHRAFQYEAHRPGHFIRSFRAYGSAAEAARRGRRRVREITWRASA